MTLLEQANLLARDLRDGANEYRNLPRSHDTRAVTVVPIERAATQDRIADVIERLVSEIERLQSNQGVQRD